MSARSPADVDRNLLREPGDHRDDALRRLVIRQSVNLQTFLIEVLISLMLCHPERSKRFANANRPAQSKDPMSARIAPDVNRNSPRKAGDPLRKRNCEFVNSS